MNRFSFFKPFVRVSVCFRSLESETHQSCSDVYVNADTKQIVYGSAQIKNNVIQADQYPNYDVIGSVKISYDLPYFQVFWNRMVKSKHGNQTYNLSKRLVCISNSSSLIKIKL